ncbi:MAG: hypothetical protein V4616_10875 [Bacteroidota bacterium]
MSEVKRLRVFAGPNGSGKSTLFNRFSKKYRTGFFINADELSKQLDSGSGVHLSDFGLTCAQPDLSQFYTRAEARSLLEKSNKNGNPVDLSITANIISDSKKATHNYEGAVCSLFIRHQLITAGEDFSFETVMSHPGKLDEVRRAKVLGYKTYLYFVCIDDPEVNVSRVENRVRKDGHPVPASLIIRRYADSLHNLRQAIEIFDKCYLFDNSSEEQFLIGSIEEGKSLTLEVNEDQFPNWFINHVLPMFSGTAN